MRKVKLTLGQIALIDNDDFENLSRFRWCAKLAKVLANGQKKYIAVTANYQPFLKQNKPIKMHRLIMKCPPGLTVDHIDGNTLNNRKSNLRIATLSENNKNKRSLIKPRSGLKGVYAVANSVRRWRSQIMSERKLFYLGTFATKEEAVLAYNGAAKVHHQKFANFS